MVDSPETSGAPEHPRRGAPADSTVAQPEGQIVGGRIGPYKILQLIGEGGFGSVFMAEQSAPLQRSVAIKIIKLGMDTRQVVARFEQERQALALMDHPNVARVLDAGATDTGRPYFVMDLCRGESITAYCDRHNLSIPDRLALFVQVCNAVQHAHQKGIIHRDIKPSNILVSMQDGRAHAKVIDFGIAKAIATRLTDKTLITEQRQLIGTPEYMSPEQAEGSLDIDTRTDVYSLGVLLYELLTGSTPFDAEKLRDAPFGEVQRIIREVEPPRPSTRLSRSGEALADVAAHRHTEPRRLGTLVRGDLDWIVMRAMEKDRTRRYAAASDLAADIERYLADEPVLAGPPSTVYRLRKFARRNRVQVVSALVVLAILAGAIVVGTILALEAESARRDAVLALGERDAALEAERKRLRQVETVASFQASQLRDLDPVTVGVRLRRSLLDAVPRDRQPSLAESLIPVNFTDLALGVLRENIFEGSLRSIDAEFATQPIVQAQLLQSLADALRELGLLDEAVDPQTRALALRRTTLGPDDPRTLDSMASMGMLLRARNNLSEAEALARESLEGRRRVLGPLHPDTLTSLNNVGYALLTEGDFDRAEPLLREALAGRKQVLGPADRSTLISQVNLASLFLRRQELPEAEALLRDTVASSRRTLGGEHTSTLHALSNFGLALAMQGKFDDAAVAWTETLEGYRAALGSDHPSTLVALHNLARLQRVREQFPQASELALESHARNLARFGPTHRETQDAVNLLVGIYEDWAKAEPDAGHNAEAERWRKELVTQP